jgi:hypothetical protein
MPVVGTILSSRNWHDYKTYLPAPPIKVGHIAHPDKLELSYIKASQTSALLETVLLKLRSGH